MSFRAGILCRPGFQNMVTGQIVSKQGVGSNRFKTKLWDKSFQNKALGKIGSKQRSDKSFRNKALEQIVSKQRSETNRSKPKRWDKSFQNDALGQIVSKQGAGTNRFKTTLWDKSFQNKALGKILACVSLDRRSRINGESIGTHKECGTVCLGPCDGVKVQTPCHDHSSS